MDGYENIVLQIINKIFLGSAIKSILMLVYEKLMLLHSVFTSV